MLPTESAWNTYAQVQQCDIIVNSIFLGLILFGVFILWLVDSNK